MFWQVGGYVPDEAVVMHVEEPEPPKVSHSSTRNAAMEDGKKKKIRQKSTFRRDATTNNEVFFLYHGFMAQ